MGLLSLYVNNKAGGLIYHKVRTCEERDRTARSPLTRKFLLRRTLPPTARSSM